jgi:uncharacterized protein
MELIPLIQPGRQIIERYGPTGFRVSGVIHLGPVLVFADRTMAWEAAAMTSARLAQVVEHGGVELLLLGLGRRMVPISAALRASLKAEGIAVEAMDTGAACRTYNLLLAEDRRVAAALLQPV